MERSSRIEAARRRASALKRVLAGVAAAAFVLAGLAARATHPGHTARAGSTTGSRSDAATSDESGESDDGFAIAPSPAQPQVQTNVS